MSFFPILQAAAAGGSGGGLLVSVLPFVLIFVIFYFFIIRPQNKKQKDTEKMISALKKGDKIITIGGIHGVISSSKEQTVIIKVDDNTKIEFNRSAIASVVSDKVDSKASEKADAKAAKAEVKPVEAATEGEAAAGEESK